MAKLSKLESVEDRLREIERILIGKGHMRASTKQAKAINLICDNMELFESLVEKSRERS